MSLGLSIIFLLSGLTLNLLIRIVFYETLEKTISKTMEETMDNARYQLQQKFLLEGINIDSNLVESNSSSIVRVMKSLSATNVVLYDDYGKIIDSDRNQDERSLGDIDLNKASVNIKYDNDKILVKGTYPLYINNCYLTTIVFHKDFNDIYFLYNNLLIKITFIQILIFFLILISSYLYTTKIIKPIKMLRSIVDEVSNGNFEAKNNIKGNDEIADLANSFFSMKSDLRDQFYNLKNEQEKTKVLEKSRTEFFYNVTHELKTPLTAISGYSQILMDSKETKEEFKKRAAQRIFIESEKLHSLVVDIINISKGVTSLKKDLESFFIVDIVDEVLESLEITIKDKGIVINKDVLSEKILFQKQSLETLIKNIIGNAVKYSVEDEIINLSIRIIEQELKITCKNKTLKLKENRRDKILEPFVRGGNSEDNIGHGLGLYICNEIVKEFDGSLKIDFSQIDNSTEWFELNCNIKINFNNFVIID